jgi:hypothetical protein
MNMMKLVEYKLAEETVLGENPLQYCSVHQKSNMTGPGTRVSKIAGSNLRQ